MKTIYNFIILGPGLLFCYGNACMPQFEPAPGQTYPNLEEPPRDFPGSPDTSTDHVKKRQTVTKAKMIAIGDQSFNAQVPVNKVWNSAIEVLMKNYNLTILDRDNGVITTEWDSFYLNGKILRNKISLRITSLPYYNSRISIINNTEAALDHRGGTPSPHTWVPSEDLAGEAARVISSIAASLNLSPPTFPSLMAKYYKAPKENPVLR